MEKTQVKKEQVLRQARLDSQSLENVAVYNADNEDQTTARGNGHPHSAL